MGASLIVHIGSGHDIRRGWINIDQGIITRIGPNHTIAIGWDLTTGIPVDDAAADAIYSSHFLEHLEHGAALALLRECLRILRPGGKFRASLPDARKTIRAYLSGDTEYWKRYDALVADDGLPPPETRSPIDYLYREGVAWQHKALYDPDKIGRLLAFVGFEDFSEVEFDPAWDPGTEVRRAASFYVEARKPR